ncbi:acetate--CoA ligase family protein [Phenylobacterium sp. LjRoot219]|uniref:acetate--CoA ligase family protein n=1 Tax=Phenylobacterium sp. LjRoot219 TaxID=3342283 RepID=UPI003ED01E1A
MNTRGDGLGGFFQPRNIALVGASDKSAWSRMIFSRFAAYGHEGELFAVNRSGAPAHGLPGFTSLADIPATVDMAYIYVPAAAAAEAIRLTGAAGIRHAVVLSSGFAEAGEEGACLQAELLAAAEAAGVLMLGPNSLGFANIADRCVCTSIPTRLPVIPGRLAILSQSGALAAEFGKFAHAQGIGLSFMGATGNEAQLGVADVLEYLVDDPATGAIALYVESIQDPNRFIAAAARARAAAKPITILKLGRSPVSAAVAQAHTGSLVGDDRIFDAMCRCYGVLRTNSLEELILTASFLEKVGPINPPRVGMASISGGACGLYADLAELHGLAMPPFAEPTQARLREVLPEFAATLNPLDVTGVAIQDPTLWTRTLPVLTEDPGLGLIVTATATPNTPTEVAALRAGLEAVVEGCRIGGQPAVVCGLSVQDQSELQRELFQEIGLDIVLPDLDFGVRALAHLQRWSEGVLASAPPPAPATRVEARPRSERQVLEHLSAFGAPVIPAVLARDAEAAAAAAERFGGPVVLKVASADIVHKTEAGGVRLNVVGAAQAAVVFAEIVSAARAYAPTARIDGALVSPMREPGVELIVGVARDPQWGPAIVVGLGGVLTEVLQDTQVRLLPVSAAEAQAMLQALKGARLLQGFRGAPPADLARLAEVIVAIGDAALALGPELAALEVNPLWVRGEAIECLDGLAAYST